MCGCANTNPVERTELVDSSAIQLIRSAPAAESSRRGGKREVKKKDRALVIAAGGICLMKKETRGK